MIGLRHGSLGAAWLHGRLAEPLADQADSLTSETFTNVVLHGLNICYASRVTEPGLFRSDTDTYSKKSRIRGSGLNMKIQKRTF